MKVNGEEFQLSGLRETTIDALLKHLELAKERIALEYNGNIIKKKDYSQIILKEEDKLEIFHFVGGG